MNIAVIGLGSMGKRRIRLIKELYPSYSIIGIDARADRRAEVEREFNIYSADSLNNFDGSIDCVFVCTSPLSHNGIIQASLLKGCHVFTELNLVSDGYTENMKLAEEKGLKLFLSSTFLYREETRYIKKKAAEKPRWNYIYHIGQYLPDWHPWESYKDFFLGDKRTNGCREILSIELPWLIDAFGDVVAIESNRDKLTGLNIDYNDNFMIQLNHRNGSKGCLIVDVVSPVAVRNLELFAENEYLTWNGTPESLNEYNSETKTVVAVSLSEKTEHAEGYSAFVVENAYKNEIREFFNYVLCGKGPCYTFEQDLEILRLIDKIGA